LSLRRQFVLVFVAFSVAVTAVGGWFAYRTTSRTLARELDDKLTQVAGAAAEVGFGAGAALLFQPGDEVTPLWQSYHARLLNLRRYVREAYIFRTDLTLLVSSLPADSLPIGSTLYELAPFAEEIAYAEEWQTSTTTPFEGEDGRTYGYGFVRLEESEAILGVLMSAGHLEPLSEFRSTIIWGSILSAFIAAAIAWLLATTVSRPLDRLGRVAIRIQRGRMSEEVRQEGGSELGRLSRAMERMRVGILHRDEQLRLMLAQVAHEIRNPLGGLELFASAAAETKDPEERDRFLQKVRSEIVALNAIIDDFLTFARPLKPERGLHDLRGPVSGAVELVEMELLDAGGKLNLELPPDPLIARADPEHVKRVVLNLVRNAAQAGDHVLVEAHAERGEVAVTVKDDGPGVAEEIQERIFEPFVTDKEKGAGLGLAIVKRVVELNGGRVELAQEEGAIGEGTEFRVYFRGAEDLPAAGTGDDKGIG
jgi:signal transduction histidine kinase